MVKYNIQYLLRKNIIYNIIKSIRHTECGDRIIYVFYISKNYLTRYVIIRPKTGPDIRIKNNIFTIININMCIFYTHVL